MSGSKGFTAAQHAFGSPLAARARVINTTPTSASFRAWLQPAECAVSRPEGQSVSRGTPTGLDAGGEIGLGRLSSSVAALGACV